VYMDWAREEVSGVGSLRLSSVRSKVVRSVNIIECENWTKVPVPHHSAWHAVAWCSMS
jgi:hypothetical protein